MAGTNWATTDAYMKRRRTPRHHGLGLLLLLLVIAYGGTATTAGTTTTVAGDKVGPFAPIPEPADPVPGGTSSCAWGVPGCPCGYVTAKPGNCSGVQATFSGCKSVLAGAPTAAGTSQMCYPCQPGTYMRTAAWITPNLAEAGPSQPSTCGRCMSCIKGTYQWQYGADLCHPCMAGTYGKIVCGTDYYSTCQVCPAGYFSGKGAALCTRCPAGTSTPNDNLERSHMACTRCPAGYSTNNQTGTPCTPCPVGSSSKSGDAHCTPCPAGTYADSPGMLCSKCPSGTYSTTVGATSNTTCLSCPVGSAAGVGYTACSSCPQGTTEYERRLCIDNVRYAKLSGRRKLLQSPFAQEGFWDVAKRRPAAASDASWQALREDLQNRVLEKTGWKAESVTWYWDGTTNEWNRGFLANMPRPIMTGWSMGEEDWGGKPPLWVASSESSYADTTVKGDCVPPRNVGRDRQQTITTSWTETQAFKAGAEFSFTFSQSLGVKDIAHTSATQGMKLSFDWTGTVSTSSATSKTDLYKGSTTMGERCAKDNDWMAMGRMIFGKEFTCEGVATVYVSPILCGGFGFVLKSDDGSGAEGSGAEGWIPVTDRTYLWPLWNRDGEPEKSIAWSKADALNTDTGYPYSPYYIVSDQPPCIGTSTPVTVQMSTYTQTGTATSLVFDWDNRHKCMPPEYEDYWSGSDKFGGWPTSNSGSFVTTLYRLLDLQNKSTNPCFNP